MAPIPTPLTSRFRLAKPKDMPTLRAFFARLLDQGGTQFDAFAPSQPFVFPGFLPAYDIWWARSKGEVVAAGWFQLFGDGRVRVVALTDPAHDVLTSPLLACIEAALQVIAYDGRSPITELTAWVPDGEHGERLCATYLRRGWTYVSRPWVTRLHQASLRRDPLLKMVAQAQAAGVELRSLTEEVRGTLQGLTDRYGPLNPMYDFDSMWEARVQGRPVAVTGIRYLQGYGEVASVEPEWWDEAARSELIGQALLASVLLERATLPDTLTGTGELSALEEWLSGVIEVSYRDGYTLAIDATREPLAWEFGLGFNPDRVFLQFQV